MAVHAQELGIRNFLEISDGQRQRILLARAICQEPEVMILDEPTSYLDIRHKLELLEILRKMAKEKEITVIMSLHEIDLAQKISDKVVCVKGDRIAGFGNPEEIFTEEKIRELYGLIMVIIIVERISRQRILIIMPVCIICRSHQQ